jgi:hypothetical protein
VTEIVPLNTINNVIVTLSPSKRYLIYDYIKGEVVKEIQPLRGSTFSTVVCPRELCFDIETNPEIIIFNQSTIRRVDILTFEIKKNIDLAKMKLPVQPPASYPASLNNKTLSQQKAHQYSYMPTDLTI